MPTLSAFIAVYLRPICLFQEALTAVSIGAIYLAYAKFTAVKVEVVIGSGLSRREREIMDILYQRGKASATEVLSAMADPPSYSAVRAMLRVLEDKGHVRHENEGLKYVFVPVVNRDKAKKSAVKHLVDTFFRDSPEQMVAALLDVSARRLTRQELDRMSAMIEQAKREGK